MLVATAPCSAYRKSTMRIRITVLVTAAAVFAALASASEASLTVTLIRRLFGGTVAGL
jgi:hypothetical protein